MSDSPASVGDQSEIVAIQRETTSSVNLQRAKDGTYYWDIKAYGLLAELDTAVIDRIKDADVRLSRLFLPQTAAE